MPNDVRVREENQTTPVRRTISQGGISGGDEDRDFNLWFPPAPIPPQRGMAGLNEAWARGAAKSFAVFRVWPRIIKPE